MTKDETMEFLETLTERYILDYGNLDMFEQDNDFVWYVEAPNHATTQVWLSNYTELSKDDIINELIETLRAFDPEMEFEEIWSPEFIQHNHFSTFQFVEMLRDDKQYFDETIAEIEATRNEFE